MSPKTTPSDAQIKIRIEVAGCGCGASAELADERGATSGADGGIEEGESWSAEVTPCR